jgi:hypothetical protein
MAQAVGTTLSGSVVSGMADGQQYTGDGVAQRHGRSVLMTRSPTTVTASASHGITRPHATGYIDHAQPDRRQRRR